MKKEKKKGENLKYCLRYQCKCCPKERECERGDTVEGNTNAKTRKVHTKYSKRYEPKTSV